MRPVIGYYVHHHGTGHRHRFERIREASGRRVDLVPLSELPFTDGLRLPPDAPTSGSDPTAGGGLHWAPVPSPELARRSSRVLQWIEATQPAGVVVDVSVEMTLLCRLAGIPTIVVRQHGDRTDAAHDTALRSARRLLAPFPETLEHATTPSWVVDKTSYAGLIGPDRTVAVTPPLRRPRHDDVVVVWGTGGGRVTAPFLRQLALAADDRLVWCVGRSDCFDVPEHPRVVDFGWIDDLAGFLVDRPTVVASAGNNAVADVASLRCPLVVIPQHRPYDEQVRHAESLDAAGVVAVTTTDAQVAELAVALHLARLRQLRLAALAEREGAPIAASIVATELVGSVV